MATTTPTRISAPAAPSGTPPPKTKPHTTPMITITDMHSAVPSPTPTSRMARPKPMVPNPHVKLATIMAARPERLEEFTACSRLSTP
eukprot:541434-Hanusia_phi.AAC.1